MQFKGSCQWKVEFSKFTNTPSESNLNRNQFTLGLPSSRERRQINMGMKKRDQLSILHICQGRFSKQTGRWHPWATEVLGKDETKEGSCLQHSMSGRKEEASKNSLLYKLSSVNRRSGSITWKFSHNFSQSVRWGHLVTALDTVHCRETNKAGFCSVEMVVWCGAGTGEVLQGRDWTCPFWVKLEMMTVPEEC